MSDEAVCRTAPATPGLLNMDQKLKIFLGLSPQLTSARATKLFGVLTLFGMFHYSSESQVFDN